MSDFFSLGGKDQNQEQQQVDTNNSLFLFKNEEIYNKGFELWQQYYQLHQQTLQSQQKQQNSQNNFQDVGFAIGHSKANDNSTNICDESPNYSHRSAGFRVMGQGMNCQDCGNKAKKECAYMRCRACCKSRGFQCQTHVKSTWVPAAKRRERQQQLAASKQEQKQVTIRGENSKRMKENPGFVLEQFPAEVNCPAVFRCVRVSAADDPDEHLAYHTTVSIGGHVFKGVLYDQGRQNRCITTSGGNGESFSRQQQQDLIAPVACSGPYITTLDPSVYSTAPLAAFMAGTQFFPPPRT